MRFPKVVILSAFAALLPSLRAVEPIKVKVVVIAMFEVGQMTGDRPGEFQYWVEREKLDVVYPFPQGWRDLRGNADGSILGVVTGVGTAKSTASIMALGLDPRFDLTQAYFVVAGIAGVDPEDASIGSAAWAEWLVDGDLAHEIDRSEIDPSWPTGYIPLRRHQPYEQPAKYNEGEAYRLDPEFVEWAFQLTKDIKLDETEGMIARRKLYTNHPKAQESPKVLKGDHLAAMTYWHGGVMNEWANRWVEYYSGGAGNFVTSAMEDTGTMQSLTWLDRAGKVDSKRVLVLRTASNFVMQWPGATAAESLSGEKLGAGYSAYIPSLEAAHRVGGKVVHAIVDGWDVYASEIPGHETR